MAENILEANPHSENEINTDSSIESNGEHIRYMINDEFKELMQIDTSAHDKIVDSATQGRVKSKTGMSRTSRISHSLVTSTATIEFHSRYYMPTARRA